MQPRHAVKRRRFLSVHHATVIRMIEGFIEHITLTLPTCPDCEANVDVTGYCQECQRFTLPPVAE